MKKLHKKGSGLTTGELIMILLALVVLGVLVYMLITGTNPFSRFISPNANQTSGGECRYACESEERMLPHVKCKNPAQKYCIPFSEGAKEPSPECNGKPTGEKCDNVGYKICDDSLQCITRCDYCAKNPAAELCKTGATGNRNTVAFTNEFSCQCTRDDCRVAGVKCVYNYCSADTGGSYCCSKP